MSEKGTRRTPVSPRHRARELALQGIYEWRINGASLARIEQRMQGEPSLGRYDKGLCNRLLAGVLAHADTLQTGLAPHLDRPLDELSPVELSVLLLGAYELVHHLEVPYKVVINEAVELAKTFGGTDGHKFVNGVLDKLALQARSAETRNLN